MKNFPDNKPRSYNDLTVAMLLFATFAYTQSPIAADQKTVKDGGQVRTSAHAAKTVVANKVSSNLAIALVKKRADVKRFLSLFPQGHSAKTDGVPVIEAEDDGANWNVHVFEQMPDHTATMNWFVVSKKTGAIKILVP